MKSSEQILLSTPGFCLNNGVSIPQLGLGVYKAPNGEQTENAVKWALEAGYRHIDTAMIYENEESVGNALKKSGVPREEIFLTSKLWNDDIRKGRTRQAFYESLERLRTDYLDLYLIHWPADGYAQAWAEMETLYAEGKIRAIGVSNFQIHHLKTLEKSAKVSPAINQIESHPYFHNQEVINYCREQNIAVQVYSPLGGADSNILKDDVLRAIALQYGKTPAQIILRWHIQRGVIVFPKSVHHDRIVSNIDVFDFNLTDEDINVINSLNRNERVGPDPDNFQF